MGFSEIKRKAISCLKQGAYDHQARNHIDTKNLFLTGVVDEEYVMALLQQTSGNHYRVSPHHQDSQVSVHIFTPFKDGCWWYVKFYFIEPDVIFISVHHR